jgi:hypothetical protein
MIPKHYERDQVSGLTRLLGSIAREIEERSRALEVLEARIEALASLELYDPETLRNLEAEAAVHRRQLRLTRAEPSRLGCSLVGVDPPTFRIPGRLGRMGATKSLVWQRGAPLRIDEALESSLES